MKPSDKNLEKEIASLRRTLRMLRGPHGCPWDREQDLDDMISYLIEEAYELLQAERMKSWTEVEEELGDVFFILIFIHELLLEKRKTPLPRIVAKVHRKIVNRHPHVFGTAVATTSAESLTHWDRVKRDEKGKRLPGGLLEEVPRKLPPLRRATAIQKKAAEVGFDWPDHRGIVEKLREEIDELERELPSGGRDRVKDEIGDILFTVVNLARRFRVDPESVLEGTTAKFTRRFSAIEKAARRSPGGITGMSLDQMEKLWQRSKRRPPRPRKKRGTASPAATRRAGGRK